MSNIDTQKSEIIGEFLAGFNNPDFSGFKIQAGPGTGKTTLIANLIPKIVENSICSSEGICILSHTNSSIDSVNIKLRDQGLNCDVKTIASFFIENFLIPFGFFLLKDAQGADKGFLRKVGAGFSEQSIVSSEEWKIFYKIIESQLIKESVFILFYSFLLKKGIKCIVVDEFQDIDNTLLSVFDKIFNKKIIKIFMAGDSNQRIQYSQNSSFDNFGCTLENKSLLTTYRFGEDIGSLVNTISTSGIQHFQGPTGGSYNYVTSYDFLVNSREIFKGKRNVFLFQPSTDYGGGQNLTISISNFLENFGMIFSYAEKPLYNFHVRMFFEGVIKFIQQRKTTIYSNEIESHLKYFYQLKGQEKILFQNIISISSRYTTRFLVGILNQTLTRTLFKDDNSYNSFREFGKILSTNKDIFDVADNELVLIGNSADEDIVFSANTIHSAKGREYDNIIILDDYNTRGGSASFSQQIKADRTNTARNLFYVAVSRARETVFSFVNFD